QDALQTMKQKAAEGQEMWQGIKQSFSDKKEQFAQGDPNKKADMLGFGVEQVAEFFVGAAEVKSLLAARKAAMEAAMLRSRVIAHIEQNWTIREASRIDEYLLNERKLMEDLAAKRAAEGTGDLDFKEWADMPVSGQVQTAPNGHRLISIRDLKMFTKEMNEKNIRVVIDSKGKILPSFADGGFNPTTGQIVLKKEPTYLSAKHESYHAQQWLELGQEQYLKLTTLEREEYVYSQIMKNKDLYTSAEILFSQKYIFKLRTGEWPPPGWKGFE
ncbi:hypothetical protein B5M42_022620, partial [Paenibacillus athensensis]